MTRFFIVFFMVILCYIVSYGRSDNFELAAANRHGKQYPQVNAEVQLGAGIAVPEAQKLQLKMGREQCDKVKNDNGLWIKSSFPLDKSFYSYQLNIDGVPVKGPGKLFFYGSCRWGTGIEIPARDQDLFALKEVSQNLVRENIYFSKLTNPWKSCFVHISHGNQKNIKILYPVLYLYHGSLEDETGRSRLRHANLILDNLSAARKSILMNILKDNSYAYKHHGNIADYKSSSRAIINLVVINETVPMIDDKFRTNANREHSVIAGHSIGPRPTMRFIKNNLFKCSSLDVYSGRSNHPDTDFINNTNFLERMLSDGATIKKQFHLLFLGLDTNELSPFAGSVGAFRNISDKKGIQYMLYQLPGTSHEWLT